MFPTTGKHRWGGAIDTSSRFSVFFGRALGGKLAYATGYTGAGVAAARFGGRVALDLLDGRDTEATRLLYVRSKPVPFPPEPLRWAVVQVHAQPARGGDRNEGRISLTAALRASTAAPRLVKPRRVVTGHLTGDRRIAGADRGGGVRGDAALIAGERPVRTVEFAVGRRQRSGPGAQRRVERSRAFLDGELPASLSPSLAPADDPTVTLALVMRAHGGGPE